VETKSSEALKKAIRDYSAERAKRVALGYETPRLAALLAQKYIDGVINTAMLLGHTSKGLYECMDETVSELDPDWKPNMSKRWNRRPADLAYNVPTES